jgi:hypothetical protein
MVIGLVWSAQEPHGKAERQKFPAAFNPPLSPLMDRCFRNAHPTVFAAMLKPFSFVPRSTTGADPDSVIMDLD